jgi:hypothetical protein
LYQVIGIHVDTDQIIHDLQIDVTGSDPEDILCQVCQMILRIRVVAAMTVGRKTDIDATVSTRSTKRTRSTRKIKR